MEDRRRQINAKSEQLRARFDPPLLISFFFPPRFADSAIGLETEENFKDLKTAAVARR